MNKKALLSLVAAVVLLAGCGGGDDSPSPTAPTPTAPAPDPTAPTPEPTVDAPPDSASQSAEGLTAYLELLSRAVSETAEALDLSKFLPPTSETAEPTPVN